MSARTINAQARINLSQATQQCLGDPQCHASNDAALLHDDQTRQDREIRGPFQIDVAHGAARVVSDDAFAAPLMHELVQIDLAQLAGIDEIRLIASDIIGK